MKSKPLQDVRRPTRLGPILTTPSKLFRCLVVTLWLIGASGALADPRPQTADTVSATQLSDLQWIAGSWQGATEDGGSIEEIWSEAAANAMAGMFRWYKDESLRLYEFMLIRATESGIELRIKHFSEDLKGWEPREESMVFQLLEQQEQRAVFTMETAVESSRLTYQRVGDVLTVVLDKKVAEGESQTKFTFQAK